MPDSPRASLLHSSTGCRCKLKAYQEKAEAGFKDKEGNFIYFQIWNLKFGSKLNSFA